MTGNSQNLETDYKITVVDKKLVSNIPNIQTIYNERNKPVYLCMQMYIQILCHVKKRNDKLILWISKQFLTLTL